MLDVDSKLGVTVSKGRILKIQIELQKGIGPIVRRKNVLEKKKIMRHFNFSTHKNQLPRL